MMNIQETEKVLPGKNAPPDLWLGKPYYSLDAYCKNTFRHKCYKIA